jgi:hypothetical protein
MKHHEVLGGMHSRRAADGSARDGRGGGSAFQMIMSGGDLHETFPPRRGSTPAWASSSLGTAPRPSAAGELEGRSGRNSRAEKRQASYQIREKSKGTEEQTTARGTEETNLSLFLWLFSAPLYLQCSFSGVGITRSQRSQRSQRSCFSPAPLTFRVDDFFPVDADRAYGSPGVASRPLISCVAMRNSTVRWGAGSSGVRVSGISSRSSSMPLARAASCHSGPPSWIT